MTDDIGMVKSIIEIVRAQANFKLLEGSVKKRKKDRDNLIIESAHWHDVANHIQKILDNA